MAAIGHSVRVTVALNVSLGVFMFAVALVALGWLSKVLSKHVTKVPEEVLRSDPIFRSDRLAWSVRMFRPACWLALAAAVAVVVALVLDSVTSA